VLKQAPATRRQVTLLIAAAGIAAAVVVAASCAHRAGAFEACHALIDRLKHEVPIWKRQWFGDGSSEWVGGA
jgi:molybdopterin synthase catalytic subunit